MKSIRSLIAEKINKLRGMIEIWDDPNASEEAVGEVLAELIGQDRVVWSHIGKVARRKRASKVSTAQLRSIVVEPAEPVVQTPPVTKPADAPARKLVLSNEDRRDRLIGLLKKFVQATDHFFLKADEVRQRLDGMLSSGVKLDDEHFNVIFSAAKKAAEKGFHLINQNTSSLFYQAPVGLVDEYVFGQDGEMVQVMVGLNELPDRKAIARAFVLLDAIDALNSQNKLDEFGVGRVEALLAAAKRIEHKKLVEEIEKILMRPNRVPAKSPGTKKSKNFVDRHPAEPPQGSELPPDRSLAAQLRGIVLN